MNYTYENYLYIDNIKLMEENILLIKKKLLNMFCFIYSKYFFINSTKHFFFLKIQKIVLKTHFSEQFLKTAIKHTPILAQKKIYSNENLISYTTPWFKVLSKDDKKKTN